MGTNHKKLTSESLVTPISPLKTATVSRMQRLSRRLGWPGWAMLLVLVSGGIGFSATNLLFKLSSSPNCPEIFWPIASASMRLYCAQLEADKRTPEGLLKAIALVEALPQDHPLRSEVDNNVEIWASDLLKLAEKEFQAGRIEKAINLAEEVPNKAKAYSLVREQVEAWRETWKEGETLFVKVEESLRKSNWNQAFRWAVKLLNIGNQYWATVKYDQAVKKIYLAREESSKLDQAYIVFNRGGLENWLKALAATQKISPDSYAYQEAANLTEKIKEKLVAYGNKLVKAHNWQNLRDLAEAIPKELDLDSVASDWQMLANAGIDGEFGTVESLKSAIAAAENIDSASPVYPEAQTLLSRWRLEIEDVLQLAKARELAEPGTIDSLNAAIAQARLISTGNNRYSEAQDEIQNWQHRVEVTEDQPLLDKAREMAVAGDGVSLRAAIAQASTIRPSRALYNDAQEEIRQWQEKIERMEDQPILEQAIALGNAKDYPSAISTARRIGKRRALSLEARGHIRRWQEQVDAQENLEKAYLIAEGQTPDALIRALRILRKIPVATDVNSQRLEAMDHWSYKLLALASEQANLGLYNEAIEMAGRIPSESSVYNSAQTQIDIWRQSLNPAPPPEVAPETIN